MAENEARKNWLNTYKPPAALARLVDGGRVHHCRALDLCCGTGEHALWLATRGFDVTGVDISPAAVKAAADAAARLELNCRFVQGDALGTLRNLEGPFDFAFDLEMLNKIYPDDRAAYVRNVHDLLRPGGTYFSLCYAEEATPFAAAGRFRRTGLGSQLYYSSEEELRNVFRSYFRIEDMRTVPLGGDRAKFMAVHALMVKQTVLQGGL